MRAYCSYKHTGVKAIGAIPLTWDVKRAKYLFREVNERSTDGSETLLSVSEYFGVKPRSEAISDNENLSRAETLEGYKKCSKDDFVMNIMLAWKCGHGVTKYEGIVSPAYSVFRPDKSKILPRYVHYLSRTPMYTKYFKTLSTGIIDSRLRLYPDKFGEIFYILPSIREQEAIANFLDREITRIDSLIAEKQTFINLLKEKRQALISHVVTKGLDPSVKMKDSGVDWIGEVPEHWTVKSYRYACKIYRGKFGHRPRNDPALYDGAFPFIQTGDIARAKRTIENYKQTLNEQGVKVSQKFPAGTLVMAIAANIGVTALLGFEAYAPDSVVGFNPKDNIDLDYLRFSFGAALPALEQTSTQSTQANLNIDRIAALKAVFPPIEEQKEIVELLDSESIRIEDLIDEVKVSIELLKEHRTALISAAVTGKIDVQSEISKDAIA